MKVDFWLAALLGLANAKNSRRTPAEQGSVGYKADPGYKPEPSYAADPGYKSDSSDYKSDDYSSGGGDYPKDDYSSSDSGYQSTNSYSSDKYPNDVYPVGKEAKSWKPKTRSPEFFSLKVDQGPCTAGEDPSACQFNNFAVRLEQGIAIATPYNKWWDPNLPIFFVDDDTQAYTVSRKPLQLYIDSVTGALRYDVVGWLPPNAIAISFYKTGNNPLGYVDPSPAYFAWPSTEGRTNTFSGGTWWLCPLSGTGQYQIFIGGVNFGRSLQGGVSKEDCREESLAAINANPWRKSGYNF